MIINENCMMATLVRNNYQLRQLIPILKEYLSNNTYNITENEFEILVRYFNKTAIDISKVSEHFISGDENCGHRLKYLAQNYAKIYHPFLSIGVCLFGIVANILNVIVLSRKDMIRAPINQILTALAVTDILVMVEYIPYVCYYYMILLQKMDFPFIGAIFMLLHIHITQTLHTVSIFLTLMLAVWRYLALRFPEKVHIMCSQFRCTLGIIICYLLPVVLCIPTYTTITVAAQEITENNTNYVLYHTDLNEIFKNNKDILKLIFWFYAVFIKLLPCCILTIITCWLIRTLFVARKRKQVLGRFQCSVLKDGHPAKINIIKSERRAERTTKMLISVLCLFLLTEFPQGIFSLLIGVKGKELFLECYQIYGEIMDILALLSGSINFILYCCMNRMFRTAFRQLFKSKICVCFLMFLKSKDSKNTSKK